MNDIEKGLRDLGTRASSLGTPTPPPDLPRKARTRRIMGGLAAVGLVVMVAAGGYAAVQTFGESQRPSADGDVIAAAALATQDQGTAKANFEMTMSMGGEGFSSEVEATGLAEIDFEANRSSTEMSMEIPMVGPMLLDMIQVGDTMYTKSNIEGVDCKWNRQQVPGMSSLGGLSSGNPGNPADYLEHLKSISGEIVVVGEEEIDGIPVTHYEATMDSALLREEMLKESDESLGAGALKDVELDMEPVHVWVDDDNLVRKTTMDMGSRMTMDPGDFGDQEMSMDMDMAFSMSFFDYGEPVNIEVPSPGELAAGGLAQDPQCYAGMPGATTTQ